MWRECVCVCVCSTGMLWGRPGVGIRAAHRCCVCVRRWRVERVLHVSVCVCVCVCVCVYVCV